MSPKLLNVFLVLIPTVLYYGVISPLYTGEAGLIWTPESSIATLKAQNVQYANTINQISLVEQGVTTLNKEYASLDQSILDKTAIMLPDTIQDQVKLRNEILNIANKSGVALNGVSLTIDPKNRDQYVGNYIISFTFKARYAVFKKFRCK